MNAGEDCASLPAGLFSFAWRIQTCTEENSFRIAKIRRRSDGSLVLVEKDAVWFNPDGKEVSDEAWNAEWSRAIALLLNGCTLQVSDEDGNPVIDDSFLLLVNAADQGVEFTIPQSPRGKPWRQIVDTEDIEDPFAASPMGDSVIVGGRTLKLLSDGLIP